MFYIAALTLIYCQSGPPSGGPAAVVGAPQWWHLPFGVGSAAVAVGDADGDGHADIMALSSGPKAVLDIARTSAIGKPTATEHAVEDLGNDALGGTCGPFVRDMADFLAVLADGSVRVAWGMTKGTSKYLHNDLACQLQKDIIPQRGFSSAVGDFDGDKHSDLLILSADGRLLLLVNKGRANTKAEFKPYPLESRLTNARQFSAGTFGTGHVSEVVWLDASGKLHRAAIEIGQETAKLVREQTLGGVFSPEDHLVTGKFLGTSTDDILVGQRLLPSGDPSSPVEEPSVPPSVSSRGDEICASGDVDGNGKADLVRFCRGGEGFGENDTIVHFSSAPTDSMKGYYCSSNDGLLDIWKEGKVKPGGLDLAALGCRVGQRDVVMEVDRFEDVSEDALRATMERAKQFYAALPLATPDGGHGVNLHVIYGPSFPIKDYEKVLPRITEISPRPAWRGVVHGLVASRRQNVTLNGTLGPSLFDGGWPTLVHEFGHQLGLRHDGYYLPQTPGFPSSTGCALYPSLMSYSYAYSRNGSLENINYSDGARASFKVDQRHLSERLPFPMEKLSFLSTLPYRFRLKPGASANETLVDWNWNGVFGEADVCADINYTHGADCGPRYEVDKTDSGPVLVAHGEGPRPKVVLIYGKNQSLLMRTWEGSDRDKEGGKWSASTVITPSGVTGDATATYLSGNATWIGYPTSEGVALQSLGFEPDGRPKVGSVTVVPNARGAQPTVTSFDKRLTVLLWRNPGQPIGMRRAQPNGATVIVGPEISLDVRSEAPVAAVAGASGNQGSDLWMTRMRAGAGKNLEVLRWNLNSQRELRVADRQWVDSSYAIHRSTLLWQSEPGMDPTGRVYLLAAGPTQGAQTWSNQVLTMNVPYKDIGDGWLARGFLNSYTSSSSTGACFYDGNIVYAMRCHDGDPSRDDALTLSFYGNGATPTPMGDFDDVGHIRDFGLRESIPEVQGP